MEKDEVIKVLEEKFTESEFRYLDQRKSFSKIHILWMEKQGYKKKILVKDYRPSYDVVHEYKTQKAFYEKTKNSSKINCPQPLFVDEKKNLLMMEYIEGTDLKRLLKKPKSIDKNLLNKIIDSCGDVLAEFHKISKSKNFDEDKDYYRSSDLKEEIEIPIEDVKECGLDFFCKPYDDFAPQNILVKNSTIYLIDFSGEDYIATPHLDLALFKFKLNIIKQYPFFKYLKLNWWDKERLFERFIRRYSKVIGEEINEQDLTKIDYLEKHMIIKLKDVFENKHSTLKNKFIRWYFSSLFERTKNV